MYALSHARVWTIAIQLHIHIIHHAIPKILVRFQKAPVAFNEIHTHFDAGVQRPDDGRGRVGRGAHIHPGRRVGDDVVHHRVHVRDAVGAFRRDLKICPDDKPGPYGSRCACGNRCSHTIKRVEPISVFAQNTQILTLAQLGNYGGAAGGGLVSEIDLTGCHGAGCQHKRVGKGWRWRRRK